MSSSDILRRRIDHLTAYDPSAMTQIEVESWRLVRLQRMLVDHMLRNGYYDTAKQLASSNNIEVSLPLPLDLPLPIDLLLPFGLPLPFSLPLHLDLPLHFNLPLTFNLSLPPSFYPSHPPLLPFNLIYSLTQYYFRSY